MPRLALRPPPADAGSRVAALRRGEPEALAACYREYGDALLAVAYRLTGSRADAEDVVQDVFVGLPEALRRYEERGSLGSWLKRVTARCALMHQRRALDRRETPRDVDIFPDAGRLAERTGAGIDVAHALAALTPTLRHVFVLKTIEGYSHAEIGEMLDISANTSEVRLCRAIAQLRTMLEDK